MPRTSTDPLKAFVILRKELAAKRTVILAEIAAIEAVLAPSTIKEPITTKAVFTLVKRTKRAKNTISLKKAVVAAVSLFALSKEDILVEVKKQGYTFTTPTPLNSLNAVLYGKKPKFKVTDGKFALA